MMALFSQERKQKIGTEYYYKLLCAQGV